MCSDGKQCYRKIGDDPKEVPPKTTEGLWRLYDEIKERRGGGMALAAIGVAIETQELIEKRKRSNITSDGSLLGDTVK